VTAMRNHPTADDIYESLRMDFPRLSLGTVYRNLRTFAQSGCILEIPLLDGRDRFDFRTDKHYHMLCENCGQVFDVEVEVSVELKENEAVLNSYTLLLYGLCPKCVTDHSLPNRRMS
ncbi:MAG: transcriptional repressor, partial [Peptococcaceae bacterium]|nr:transcriptional repressor [Peptococcaceae bacterium]